MTLWPHQREAIDVINRQRAVLLDAWMGTGKSRVIVECINSWPRGRVLIACPKSVLGVWRRELTAWGSFPHQVLILDQATGKAKAKAVRIAIDSDEPLIVVLNYDAIRSASLRETILSSGWSEIICDESHRIKAPNSQISRLMHRLGRGARKLIAMTGTPTPNNPLDLFGQLRFLDERLLGTNWHSFARRFGVPEQIPGARGLIYKRFNVRMAAELRRITDPITFRAPKSVLTLPGVTHQTIPVVLGTKARRAYESLAATAEADLTEGRITAANAGVVLLHLQQLTGGIAATSDNGRRIIDAAKADALDDLLTDLPADERLIVFCRFVPELAQIQKVAKRHNRPYGEISGARKDLTTLGTMPETPGLVMGVQLQAGGLGVDLTAARIAVYWSKSFSLGDHEQSLARVHRPGQKHHVVYTHLVATDTVDELIDSCLVHKKSVIDTFLAKGLRRT
jgi:SNF2 family DNA or RNA helicase